MENELDTITLDGVEYDYNEMEPEAQYAVKQIRDLNKKLADTQFHSNQLLAARKLFMTGLSEALEVAKDPNQLELPLEPPEKLPEAQYLSDGKPMSEYVETKEAEVVSELMQKLMIPISEVSLTVRMRNCLRMYDVIHLGDLVQQTEGEVLRTPNFGRKSLNELKEVLTSYGLHFGMTVEGWHKAPLGVDDMWLNVARAADARSRALDKKVEKQTQRAARLQRRLQGVSAMRNKKADRDREKAEIVTFTDE